MGGLIRFATPETLRAEECLCVLLLVRMLCVRHGKILSGRFRCYDGADGGERGALM